MVKKRREKKRSWVLDRNYINSLQLLPLKGRLPGPNENCFKTFLRKNMRTLLRIESKSILNLLAHLQSFFYSVICDGLCVHIIQNVFGEKLVKFQIFAGLCRLSLWAVRPTQGKTQP